MANFYNQSEKIIKSLKSIDLKGVPNSIGKKKAPQLNAVISTNQNSPLPPPPLLPLNTIIETLESKTYSNKEIINNSIKVSFL